MDRLPIPGGAEIHNVGSCGTVVTSGHGVQMCNLSLPKAI